MANKRAKKATRRKKRRKNRRPDMPLQILKGLGVLAALIALVVIAAVMAHFLIKRPQGYVPPAVQMPVPPVENKAKPEYEVYPEKPLPPDKPITRLRQLPGDHPPIVAIVIDDIGYDRQIADQMLSLDAPLTFSVLPHGPHSVRFASEARAKGREIMLHLPMEPDEFPEVNPGPGALLTQMSADELIAQLNSNLDLIPGLKGVNNHMGSGISKSPERMRQIFSILKKRGLYYIDSRTTAETVARRSARLFKLPFAERDIFIDHVEDENFIRSQLKRLIRRAQKQGYAIGIAHPHKVTHRVLADYLTLLKDKVALVPASMVVEAETQAQSAQRLSTSNPLGLK
ncbi:MAG: divergent polysaccharide deacetylase family protein [Desulfobacteraceae bacterium]|jgi:hypothetical protein